MQMFFNPLRGLIRILIRVSSISTIIVGGSLKRIFEAQSIILRHAFVNQFAQLIEIHHFVEFDLDPRAASCAAGSIRHKRTKLNDSQSKSESDEHLEQGSSSSESDSLEFEQDTVSQSRSSTGPTSAGWQGHPETGQDGWNFTSKCFNSRQILVKQNIICRNLKLVLARSSILLVVEKRGAGIDFLKIAERSKAKSAKRIFASKNQILNFAQKIKF